MNGFVKYLVQGMVIAFIAAYHVPAHSHGLGIYINGAAGLNRYEPGRYLEFDGPVSIWSPSAQKGTITGYGCGVMMDTDPDSDRLFNYRIYTGYNRMHVIIPNMINLHAVRFNNTFGFRLYRDDTLKLWLGPQVGLDYLWGGDSHSTREFISNYMLQYPPFNGVQPVRYRRRYSLMSVNAGLVLGLNINMSSRVTLSVEAGGRVYNTFSMREIDCIPPSGSIEGFEGYVLFGVLGRVN